MLKFHHLIFAVVLAGLCLSACSPAMPAYTASFGDCYIEPFIDANLTSLSNRDLNPHAAAACA